MFSIIERYISSVSNELSKNCLSNISKKEQSKIFFYFDKVKKLFEILDTTFQGLEKDILE